MTKQRADVKHQKTVEQRKCAAFNKIVKILGKNHNIKLDAEFDSGTTLDTEKLKAIQAIIDSEKL